MIDPLTSLAFSVNSGKGVYAILLGSGVSRAAFIPTGWEVTLDLIRKVAKSRGEDCDPDPAAWYQRNVGTEPTYSSLLETLAQTPAERANALSAYFEPTDDERAEGRKLPTRAHHAIAQLVIKGYVRVILTTNFDRLMENALQAAGVNPIVISTADMARGALPLAHAQCTLVKVNGDYRDTRLRNTSQELAAYDAEMDTLIDRILDEYGLVICGWSAIWDEALRKAFLRCANRRFTTFWATKATTSPEASSLIQFRQASVIGIDSADQFFGTLSEKIDALEKFNTPHPLSKAIAIASLKKYISDDRYRIELHDLVMDEAERQLQAFSPLSVESDQPTCDDIEGRLSFYENSMATLASLVAYGSYWGRPSQAITWVRVIARMVDAVKACSGNSFLIELQRYPACILMFACGVASAAAGNYATLKILLRDARTSVDSMVTGTDDLLMKGIGLAKALNDEILNRCAKQKVPTPSSDRVHRVLRDLLRPLLPSDSEYDDAFDRFEYLYSLADFGARDRKEKRVPIGRFGWRNRERDTHVSAALLREFERDGSNWAPLKAGLFDSSSQFAVVEKAFRELILSKYPLSWYERGY